MLAAPRFHHLHLNSMDPDAAIDFYVRQFPSTSRGRWEGMPALNSPNDVMLLFNKVESPSVAHPQSAIWHFGWHVTDARRSLEAYRSRLDVNLLPLYTSEEGGAVFISSDTWPGTGGVLGLTRDQIADARIQGVQPLGGPGFAYMEGPDCALVEYAGDYPAERFNHVHMFQEQSLCAVVWYQQHLQATPMVAPADTAMLTEATCRMERGPDATWPALESKGMLRTPKAAVAFGDVMLTWYAPQDDRPLVPTRGQLYDHIALSVSDLDAWIARLRADGVTFLEQPYRLGATRAVMIEGPSREALELVETR